MIETKQQVIASIADARDHLDSALSDLERLPAFDYSSIPFAAHALSNFLTFTEGTVELILASLPDGSDPQVSRLLDGLRHATALMMHSVSQLMNNASTRKLNFRFEKFDLPRLAQRACEYYQRVALRKHIRLTYHLTADVPLVSSDRVAVAAVMDNLLSNAVKYSPIGKPVRLTVGLVDGDAVFSVEDEGPGISVSERSRLFQRGVTLSSVATGGEPSTGYGLAVAKELVDQLGGTIWVETVLGQGARFSVRLPIQPPPPRDHAESPAVTRSS